MYVCMHVRMSRYIFIYHTSYTIHHHVNAYVCVYVYVCIYVYVCVYVYPYVCLRTPPV
jgi:hypothetical protein